MDIALIILFSTLVLGTLCLLYGFFVEPLWVKRRKVEVRFPSSWSRIPCEGKRIVFFSDLHTCASTTEKMLLQRMRAVMREKPDAIIFGGDLVEERTPLSDPDFREMVLRALASLDAPLGKWAILGNHDVEAPRNRAWSVPLLRETGFTVLENEGIELCGLPVWGFANALHYEPKLHNETYSIIRTKATKALGLTEPLSFSLYLVHESDWFTERISAPTPGMILSGHSHHGQVTFFGIPLIRPRMGKKHWKGFYKIGDRFTLIVSAGLGTVHIHARFFARPDVVTLTFVENNNHEAKEIEIVEL